MSSGSGWDRRGFVRTIVAVGAVGAVAGCSDGSGGDGDGGTDPTPTETQTSTETQTEAPAAGETDTESGAEGSGPIASAVDEANTIIEQMNHCGPQTDLCLENTNERLRNVEDIEYVEQVEASGPEEARQEAQRLRDEIERLHNDLREKVPQEINAQSQDQLGFDLIEDTDQYQTPEDFRQGAEELPNDRAKRAMRDAANGMERIEETLTMAADGLEEAADQA